MHLLQEQTISPGVSSLPMPAEPVGPSDTRFCETWERCLPYLTPAIERLHGTHLAEDVFDSLMALELHLWELPGGAAVTEFVPYPRKLSCSVFLAGGSLDAIQAWGAVNGPLEKWARFQGCQMIETTARRGWVKAIAGEAVQTFLVRAISDGR